MTVAELIERLKEFPLDAEVKDAETGTDVQPYQHVDDTIVWI